MLFTTFDQVRLSNARCEWQIRFGNFKCTLSTNPIKEPYQRISFNEKAPHESSKLSKVIGDLVVFTMLANWIPGPSKFMSETHFDDL